MMPIANVAVWYLDGTLSEKCGFVIHAPTLAALATLAALSVTSFMHSSYTALATFATFAPLAIFIWCPVTDTAVWHPLRFHLSTTARFFFSYSESI